MGKKKKEDPQNAVWYLDSGCSRHMTGSRDLLQEFVEKDGPQVTFGDNSRGKTKGYGTLLIGTVHIHNVTYVDGLKHNLLSVSQFCDRGYLVEFSTNICLVRNALTKQVLLTGFRNGNIYLAD